MTAMRSRTIWLAIPGLLLAGHCQAANDGEKNAVKVVENLGGRVGHGKLIIGEVVIDVVTEVNLAGSKVKDADLKHLAALKQLQTLDLRRTKVTDAGLKELAALKQLQTLSLWRTKVTDVGLKELAALKQLQTLDLGNTEVTSVGVAELQKELPKCRIIR